jgi:microcystin-dependent protein
MAGDIMGYIKSAIAVQEDVGTIKQWSKSAMPTGWLECNGQAVSRTTYATLFAQISTSYGIGDGSTTFNLPDFQGRSPKGVGTSSGGTDVTHVAETVTLGLKQNDKIQGHRHEMWGADSAVSGTGSYAQGGGVNTIATTKNTTNTFVRAATTDDTNGTPRTGDITTGKCLGVYFIIKF